MRYYTFKVEYYNRPLDETDIEHGIIAAESMASAVDKLNETFEDITELTISEINTFNYLTLTKEEYEDYRNGKHSDYS